MSISSSKQGVSKNLAIVKQYFKKPMTLIIGILSLATIITQIMMSSALGKILPAIMEAAGQEGTTSSSSGNALSYLISGVVTLCIFMIFLSSLTPSGGPTIWFTVLHVLSVLQLIFTALGALFTVLMEVIFIFSTNSIVKYMVNENIAGFGEKTEEQIDQLSRNVESFKMTLIIALIATLVIYAIVLYYINSQTAFLKSVTLTCKNPMLKSKGAVPYGNLSVFIGVLSLVGVVIIYLLFGNASTSIFADMDLEINANLPDLSSIMMPYLIYSVCSALYVVARGYFAKGWEKFAKENEQYVYEAANNVTRVSEQSPIPTFKSTTRNAKEARQQSQPYLIGEEEDKNKKSSYIPEELQNDYNDGQMYGGQGGGAPQFGGAAPYGGGQFGGDPFSQSPMGGNPYGGQGGNPYGGQGANPYGDPYGGNGGGYNNGMM